MAVTSGAIMSLIGPLVTQAGLKLGLVNSAQNASVSSFSVVCPMDTLVAALAVSIAPGSTDSLFAACTATKNTDGTWAILGDGTVTFSKSSTNAQNYTVIFLGV